MEVAGERIGIPRDRWRLICTIGWAGCLWISIELATTRVEAQELDMDSNQFNLPMPTLGGKQFWTDYRWAGGWRLQRNAVTGHWRVLDAADVRRAWGSREDCLAKFQTHASALISEPTATTSVVVLVHGLMRTAGSMDPLAQAFKRRGDGMLPIAFSYASTQASVDSHASALREWVDNLPGRPQLSFVGHSLGNIVIRRALALWQREGDPQQVLPRLHRMVMLGPPNQGSSIARRLARLGLFETITGASGRELGVAWNELQEKLAVPPCPFCIIAGDLSESSFQNPLLDGKSDFVVTLDETRLDGATQSIALPVLHSFLMSDSRAVESTVEFVEALPKREQVKPN